MQPQLEVLFPLYQLLLSAAIMVALAAAMMPSKGGSETRAAVEFVALAPIIYLMASAAGVVLCVVISKVGVSYGLRHDPWGFYVCVVVLGYAARVTLLCFLRLSGRGRPPRIDRPHSRSRAAVLFVVANVTVVIPFWMGWMNSHTSLTDNAGAFIALAIQLELLARLFTARLRTALALGWVIVTAFAVTLAITNGGGTGLTVFVLAMFAAGCLTYAINCWIEESERSSEPPPPPSEIETPETAAETPVMQASE